MPKPRVYGSAYSPASAHITYSQTYYTPRTLHYLAVRYIREVLHTVTPSYPACSRRHICHSAFAQFFRRTGSAREFTQLEVNERMQRENLRCTVPRVTVRRVRNNVCGVRIDYCLSLAGRYPNGLGEVRSVCRVFWLIIRTLNSEPASCFTKAPGHPRDRGGRRGAWRDARSQGRCNDASI